MKRWFILAILKKFLRFHNFCGKAEKIIVFALSYVSKILALLYGNFDSWTHVVYRNEAMKWSDKA